jgi:hypothetical protein
MKLLTTVERYLGSMVEWPSTVLETLFVDNPPACILKMLLAFYGNGAPFPLASQLRRVQYNSSAEDTQTYNYYDFWDRSSYVRHVSQYYNLRVQKYIYLKGKHGSV